MAKQENLSFTGEVIEELGNSMFRVKLDNMEVPAILCTISGKIRKNFIKIVAGDKVRLEVSPYDLTRGRITTRLTSQFSDNSSSINSKK
jgi:translation initiation factor IF-1